MILNYRRWNRERKKGFDRKIKKAASNDSLFYKFFN